MIIVIDNYDSFTYNLVQLAGAVTKDIRIIRNDELSAEDVKKLNPSHIILSPGPGYPKDAGICEEVITIMKDITPVMGICLGHQAICEVFGADISLAARLMHGKKTGIHIANGNRIFHGLPPIIEGGRYNSLSVVRDNLPDDLLIIAEDDDGEVMGVKHRKYEIYGLQFHPESILTERGDIIMNNFLRIGGA